MWRHCLGSFSSTTTAGGIVLGFVAVSSISADVLLHISVVIKAAFLKFNMCNILQKQYC